MEQIRTGVSAQESPSHPRPAAATVADVMQLPPTTVHQHDHAAAAAYPMKHAGTTALIVVDARAGSRGCAGRSAGPHHHRGRHCPRHRGRERRQRRLGRCLSALRRLGQAAWQVSDIRTEMAERRTHGIKVEDFDTPAPTTEVLADEPSWTRKAARAVKDLGRAKEFYSGVLGLTASDERHGTGIRYETQGGSWFLVYRSEFADKAKSTCMRFEVEDVESAVRQLRDCGIVFEEYDLPGVKTVDGIAEHESGARGAWFKDPDGNILQIGQYGK